MIVKNVSPSAIPGGPYKVSKDSSIVLSGSATDPGGPDEPITFAWDLDGDTVYGETGTEAKHGDEKGATPTFHATGLAAGSTFTVALLRN